MENGGMEDRGTEGKQGFDQGEKRVRLPCGTLELEGRLKTGPSPNVLILLHPHPLYGGDMDNQMVVDSARTMAAEGWSTLRFNFRGTGMSDGIHGGGKLEVEDVRAALAFVRERLPDRSVSLFGYSFGSYVGAQALPHLDGVEKAVFLAPPTVWGTGYFAPPDIPTLIICGDRDGFCDVRTWQNLFAGSDNVTISVLEEEDHFFSQNADLAMAGVKAFLAGKGRLG